MKKTLLFTLITASLGITAHAQTLPNAGSITRDITSDITPTAPPATVQQSTPASDKDDSTPIMVSKVNIEGATLLSAEQLASVIKSVEGTEQTLASLHQLAGQIQRLYERSGYPLAQAVLPAQRIDQGIVTIRVLENQLNEVKADNSSRLSDKTVNGYLTSNLNADKIVRQGETERALLLMRDLAGTSQVSYRLENVAQGETNLVAMLGDAKLIDGFVMLDNYGSKSTGEWRTRAGLNLNSPFGRGERLSLQAMSSFKGVDYARIGADIPMGYQGLMLNMSAGHTRYDLGGDFKDLNATGTADTVELGLRYPMVRRNDSSLWVSLGGEYRDLQDKIGATNTVTDKSLRALQLGLNGSHQHSIGAGAYTQWSFTNTFGNLDIKTADARSMDSLSAKTAGNYHKISGSLAHTQYFNPKWSMVGSVSGQWANKNLDSAEQLSLGGADSVTAYHSNNVSADLGVIGQLEARYAVSPAITLGAFYDAGRAKLRAEPFTDARNFINLHGGGIGLYTQYKGIALQSKVAWQGSDETFSNNKDPRWWLKASYSF